MLAIRHKKTGKVLLQVVTDTLENADLSGRDLAGADFAGANLSGSDLTRAKLDGADLESADLRGFNLYHASLLGANLYKASLWGADLSGVNYDRDTRWPERFQPLERGCVMDTGSWTRLRPSLGTTEHTTSRQEKPKFRCGKKRVEPYAPKLIFGTPGATTKGVQAGYQIQHRTTGLTLHRVAADTLLGADLHGVELRGALLRNARMVRSNLRGADLSEADLRAADLREAQMEGAELVEADLSGADARQADLRGANLRGANLRGASLTGTKFWGADLTGARYDSVTVWPKGFDPRSRGAVKDEPQ